MAISTDNPTKNASRATKLKPAGNAEVSALPESSTDQNSSDGDSASKGDSSIPDDAAITENKECFEVGRHEDPAGDADIDESDTIIVADIAESSSAGLAEPVRKEEVRALLGGDEVAGNEELEVAPDQDEENFAADSFQNLPAIAAEEHSAPREKYNIILEALQDSLANTQSLSSKIDTLSSDTDDLKKQLNSISLNYELLTAEMESIASGASTKGILSKSFLIISSLALTLLVIFQVYMFISLANVQRLQNAAGSSLLENINGLNKKMADYNNNLTKTLDNRTEQLHPQPNPVLAEKPSQETHENKEAGSASITPVMEKLNKLRNGLPEKKLVRKETGDWFVYNKKIEDCISDVDIVGVLNQAYRKIGRSLSANIPMPSHNALCILKPDGKGGTEVVMTKDFMP